MWRNSSLIFHNKFILLTKWHDVSCLVSAPSRRKQDFFQVKHIFHWNYRTFATLWRHLLPKMHAPVFINDTSLVFIDISPEDQVKNCFEKVRHLPMAGVNDSCFLKIGWRTACLLQGARCRNLCWKVRKRNWGWFT